VARSALLPQVGAGIGESVQRNNVDTCSRAFPAFRSTSDHLGAAGRTALQCAARSDLVAALQSGADRRDGGARGRNQGARESVLLWFRNIWGASARRPM